MKDAKITGKNANIRVNIKLDKTIKNVGKSKSHFLEWLGHYEKWLVIWSND